MTFGSYKQYDSRWGKKNYNGSSNYSQAGCGPTACANILYAIDSSITPLTTGAYMQKNGYAIRNNGTAWAGIPACLKAFGATDVQNVPTMAKVWELMAKGYVGVFLFRGGTRGGITWTNAGHYLSVQGYKVTNGKHYLKMMDSGGRDHDGWYCYETQMCGLIPQIWLCKVSASEPKSYDGTFPNIEVAYTVPKGQLIADKADEIAWTTDTSKANYKGGDSTSAFKKAIEKAYPNRSSWGIAPRKGASCDVAVGTTVRASGVDSTYPRGLDEQKKHLPKSIFKKTKVSKVADLKAGDIFYYTKGTHTAIYSGGKTKEAGYEHYYMKTLSKAYDRLEKSGFYVWRASGTASKTRAYLKKGDKGDNIRYLQNFLNWYGNYGLDADGDFGAKTETAVKDFQSKEKLTVDGLFGKGCLAKAKEVKK